MKAADAVLALVSFALCLVAAEGFVRVIDDGMNFDIEMRNYARIKQPAADGRPGHEHRPNSRAHLMGVDVEINALGLRDDIESVAKPRGVRRVVMLGDSLTFGWGVPAAETTSELLQATLNARGDGWRYEVVNMGVGNSNTEMQVAVFANLGRRLSPDAVVLNYFINDAEPTPHANPNPLARYSNAYVYFGGRVDALLRRLTVRADWQDYYRGLYEADGGNARVGRSIADLGRMTAEDGIPLLIIHYPELHVLAPYPFERVAAWLSGQATAVRAGFVDLTPAVADLPPQTLWVHPADAHPNGTANRRFAAALAVALMPLLKD
jgi:lysophospholipase L1-like esterase